MLTGRRIYSFLILLFLTDQAVQQTVGELPFISSYLDDLLLYPLFLPLWARIAGRVPSLSGLIISLLVFSSVFEVLLPRFIDGMTGDMLDPLMYASGAFPVWYYLRGHGLTQKDTD